MDSEVIKVAIQEGPTNWPIILTAITAGEARGRKAPGLRLLPARLLVSSDLQNDWQIHQLIKLMLPGKINHHTGDTTAK